MEGEINAFDDLVPLLVAVALDPEAFHLQQQSVESGKIQKTALFGDADRRPVRHSPVTTAQELEVQVDTALELERLLNAAAPTTGKVVLRDARKRLWTALNGFLQVLPIRTAMSRSARIRATSSRGLNGLVR